MHFILFLLNLWWVMFTFASPLLIERGLHNIVDEVYDGQIFIALQRRTSPKPLSISVIEGGTGGPHSRTMLRMDKGSHTIFRSPSPERPTPANEGQRATRLEGQEVDQSRPGPPASAALNKGTAIQPIKASSQRPRAKQSMVLAGKTSRVGKLNKWPYGELKKSILGPEVGRSRSPSPSGVLDGKAQSVTIIGHGPARISVGNPYRRFGDTIISPGKTKTLTIHSKHDIDGSGEALGEGGSVTAVGSGLIPIADLKTGIGGSGFINPQRGNEKVDQPRLGQLENCDYYNGCGAAYRTGNSLKQDHTITAGVSHRGKMDMYALKDGYTDEGGNQIKKGFD